MGEMRYAYESFVGNLKNREHLEDLGWWAVVNMVMNLQVM
jgi:hypothetical protein